MPRWEPVKSWKDQEVFIVGGGDSLRSFDWSLISEERTIGCNDAYIHGTDICVFGDINWFEAHERALKNYKGIVITNAPKMFHTKIPWVWTMVRESRGIHENTLAWNASTGAVAVGLAVILGAAKIYLLGFDMQLSNNGKSNWHDNLLDKPDPEVYDKFGEGFGFVAKDLRSKYPGIEVVNVTDDSKLNVFKKIGVKEFWEGR